MFLLKRKYPEYFTYQGRKVSKKLTISKKQLIDKTYNQYSLDESIIHYHRKKELNKKIVFPQNFKKINIEIGFGNGEFLINNAKSKPKELFIGIEVYLNGIAKVLTSIINHHLKNIIISNLNCLYFLEATPNVSVDKVFIINPDPWIKKRHNKRRLISPKTIKLLSNIVKSKNSIFMTTDSESYLRYVEDLLTESRELIGKYNLITLSENDDLYGISRYQKKAIEKGDKIYLLTI